MDASTLESLTTIKSCVLPINAIPREIFDGCFQFILNSCSVVSISHLLQPPTNYNQILRHIASNPLHTLSFEFNLPSSQKDTTYNAISELITDLSCDADSVQEMDAGLVQVGSRNRRGIDPSHRLLRKERILHDVQAELSRSEQLEYNKSRKYLSRAIYGKQTSSSSSFTSPTTTLNTPGSKGVEATPSSSARPTPTASFTSPPTSSHHVPSTFNMNTGVPTQYPPPYTGADLTDATPQMQYRIGHLSLGKNEMRYMLNSHLDQFLYQYYNNPFPHTPLHSLGQHMPDQLSGLATGSFSALGQPTPHINQLLNFRDYFVEKSMKFQQYFYKQQTDAARVSVSLLTPSIPLNKSHAQQEPLRGQQSLQGGLPPPLPPRSTPLPASQPQHYAHHTSTSEYSLYNTQWLAVSASMRTLLCTHLAYIELHGNADEVATTMSGQSSSTQPTPHQDDGTDHLQLAPDDEIAVLEILHSFFLTLKSIKTQALSVYHRPLVHRLILIYNNQGVVPSIASTSSSLTQSIHASIEYHNQNIQRLQTTLMKHLLPSQFIILTSDLFVSRAPSLLSIPLPGVPSPHSPSSPRAQRGSSKPGHLSKAGLKSTSTSRFSILSQLIPLPFFKLFRDSIKNITLGCPPSSTTGSPSNHMVTEPSTLITALSSYSHLSQTWTSHYERLQNGSPHPTGSVARRLDQAMVMLEEQRVQGMNDLYDRFMAFFQQTCVVLVKKLNDLVFCLSYLEGITTTAPAQSISDAWEEDAFFLGSSNDRHPLPFPPISTRHRQRPSYPASPGASSPSTCKFPEYDSNVLVFESIFGHSHATKGLHHRIYSVQQELKALYRTKQLVYFDSLEVIQLGLMSSHDAWEAAKSIQYSADSTSPMSHSHGESPLWRSHRDHSTSNSNYYSSSLDVYPSPTSMGDGLSTYSELLPARAVAYVTEPIEQHLSSLTTANTSSTVGSISHGNHVVTIPLFGSFGVLNQVRKERLKQGFFARFRSKTKDDTILPNEVIHRLSAYGLGYYPLLYHPYELWSLDPYYQYHGYNQVPPLTNIPTVLPSPHQLSETSHHPRSPDALSPSTASDLASIPARVSNRLHQSPDRLRQMLEQAPLNADKEPSSGVYYFNYVLPPKPNQLQQQQHQWLTTLQQQLQKGRIAKYIGDIFLMTALPVEALSTYDRIIDEAKELKDHTLLGSLHEARAAAVLTNDIHLGWLPLGYLHWERIVFQLLHLEYTVQSIYDEYYSDITSLSHAEFQSAIYNGKQQQNHGSTIPIRSELLASICSSLEFLYLSSSDLHNALRSPTGDKASGDGAQQTPSRHEVPPRSSGSHSTSTRVARDHDIDDSIQKVLNSLKSSILNDVIPLAAARSVLEPGSEYTTPSSSDYPEQSQYCHQLQLGHEAPPQSPQSRYTTITLETITSLRDALTVLVREPTFYYYFSRVMYYIHLNRPVFNVRSRHYLQNNAITSTSPFSKEQQCDGHRRGELALSPGALGATQPRGASDAYSEDLPSHDHDHGQALMVPVLAPILQSDTDLQSIVSAITVYCTQVERTFAAHDELKSIVQDNVLTYMLFEQLERIALGNDKDSSLSHPGKDGHSDIVGACHLLTPKQMVRCANALVLMAEPEQQITTPSFPLSTSVLPFGPLQRTPMVLGTKPRVSMMDAHGRPSDSSFLIDSVLLGPNSSPLAYSDGCDVSTHQTHENGPSAFPFYAITQWDPDQIQLLFSTINKHHPTPRVNAAPLIDAGSALGGANDEAEPPCNLAASIDQTNSQLNSLLGPDHSYPLRTAEQPSLESPQICCLPVMKPLFFLQIPAFQDFYRSHYLSYLQHNTFHSLTSRYGSHVSSLSMPSPTLSEIQSPSPKAGRGDTIYIDGHTGTGTTATNPSSSSASLPRQAFPLRNQLLSGVVLQQYLYTAQRQRREDYHAFMASYLTEYRSHHHLRYAHLNLIPSSFIMSFPTPVQLSSSIMLPSPKALLVNGIHASIRSAKQQLQMGGDDEIAVATNTMVALASPVTSRPTTATSGSVLHPVLDGEDAQHRQKTQMHGLTAPSSIAPSVAPPSHGSGGVLFNSSSSSSLYEYEQPISLDTGGDSGGGDHTRTISSSLRPSPPNTRPPSVDAPLQVLPAGGQIPASLLLLSQQLNPAHLYYLPLSYDTMISTIIDAAYFFYSPMAYYVHPQKLSLFHNFLPSKDAKESVYSHLSAVASMQYTAGSQQSHLQWSAFSSALNIPLSSSSSSSSSLAGSPANIPVPSSELYRRLMGHTHPGVSSCLTEAFHAYSKSTDYYLSSVSRLHLLNKSYQYTMQSHFSQSPYHLSYLPGEFILPVDNLPLKLHYMHLIHQHALFLSSVHQISSTSSQLQQCQAYHMYQSLRVSLSPYSEYFRVFMAVLTQMSLVYSTLAVQCSAAPQPIASVVPISLIVKSLLTSISHPQPMSFHQFSLVLDTIQSRESDATRGYQGKDSGENSAGIRPPRSNSNILKQHSDGVTTPIQLISLFTVDIHDLYASFSPAPSHVANNPTSTSVLSNHQQYQHYLSLLQGISSSISAIPSSTLGSPFHGVTTPTTGSITHLPSTATINPPGWQSMHSASVNSPTVTSRPPSIAQRLLATAAPSAAVLPSGEDHIALTSPLSANLNPESQGQLQISREYSNAFHAHRQPQSMHTPSSHAGNKPSTPHTLSIHNLPSTSTTSTTPHSTSLPSISSSLSSQTTPYTLGLTSITCMPSGSTVTKQHASVSMANALLAVQPSLHHYTSEFPQFQHIFSPVSTPPVQASGTSTNVRPQAQQTPGAQAGKHGGSSSSSLVENVYRHQQQFSITSIEQFLYIMASVCRISRDITSLRRKIGLLQTYEQEYGAITPLSTIGAGSPSLATTLSAATGTNSTTGAPLLSPRRRRSSASSSSSSAITAQHQGSSSMNAGIAMFEDPGGGIYPQRFTTPQPTIISLAMGASPPSSGPSHGHSTASLQSFLHSHKPLLFPSMHHEQYHKHLDTLQLIRSTHSQRSRQSLTKTSHHDGSDLAYDNPLAVYENEHKGASPQFIMQYGAGGTPMLAMHHGVDISLVFADQLGLQQYEAIYQHTTTLFLQAMGILIHAARKFHLLKVSVLLTHILLGTAFPREYQGDPSVASSSSSSLPSSLLGTSQWASADTGFQVMLKRWKDRLFFDTALHQGYHSACEMFTSLSHTIPPLRTTPSPSAYSIKQSTQLSRDLYSSRRVPQTHSTPSLVSQVYRAWSQQHRGQDGICGNDSSQRISMSPFGKPQHGLLIYFLLQMLHNDPRYRSIGEAFADSNSASTTGGSLLQCSVVPTAGKSVDSTELDEQHSVLGWAATTLAGSLGKPLFSDQPCSPHPAHSGNVQDMEGQAALDQHDRLSALIADHLDGIFQVLQSTDVAHILRGMSSSSTTNAVADDTDSESDEGLLVDPSKTTAFSRRHQHAQQLNSSSEEPFYNPYHSHLPSPLSPVASQRQLLEDEGIIAQETPTKARAGYMPMFVSYIFSLFSLHLYQHDFHNAISLGSYLLQILMHQRVANAERTSAPSSPPLPSTTRQAYARAEATIFSIIKTILQPIYGRFFQYEQPMSVEPVVPASASDVLSSSTQLPGFYPTVPPPGLATSQPHLVRTQGTMVRRRTYLTLFHYRFKQLYEDRFHYLFTKHLTTCGFYRFEDQGSNALPFLVSRSSACDCYTTKLRVLRKLTLSNNPHRAGSVQAPGSYAAHMPSLSSQTPHESGDPSTDGESTTDPEHSFQHGFPPSMTRRGAQGLFGPYSSQQHDTSLLPLFKHKRRPKSIVFAPTSQPLGFPVAFFMLPFPFPPALKQQHDQHLRFSLQDHRKDSLTSDRGYVAATAANDRKPLSGTDGIHRHSDYYISLDYINHQKQRGVFPPLLFNAASAAAGAAVAPNQSHLGDDHMAEHSTSRDGSKGSKSRSITSLLGQKSDLISPPPPPPPVFHAKTKGASSEVSQKASNSGDTLAHSALKPSPMGGLQPPPFPTNRDLGMGPNASSKPIPIPSLPPLPTLLRTPSSATMNSVVSASAHDDASIKSTRGGHHIHTSAASINQYSTTLHAYSRHQTVLHTQHVLASLIGVGNGLKGYSRVSSYYHLQHLQKLQLNQLESQLYQTWSSYKTRSQTVARHLHQALRSVSNRHNSFQPIEENTSSYQGYHNTPAMSASFHGMQPHRNQIPQPQPQPPSLLSLQSSSAIFRQRGSGKEELPHASTPERHGHATLLVDEDHRQMPTKTQASTLPSATIGSDMLQLQAHSHASLPSIQMAPYGPPRGEGIQDTPPLGRHGSASTSFHQRTISQPSMMSHKEAVSQRQRGPPQLSQMASGLPQYRPSQHQQQASIVNLPPIDGSHHHQQQEQHQPPPPPQHGVASSQSIEQQQYKSITIQEILDNIIASTDNAMTDEYAQLVNMDGRLLGEHAVSEPQTTTITTTAPLTTDSLRYNLIDLFSRQKLGFTQLLGDFLPIEDCICVSPLPDEPMRTPLVTPHNIPICSRSNEAHIAAHNIIHTQGTTHYFSLLAQKWLGDFPTPIHDSDMMIKNSPTSRTHSPTSTQSTVISQVAELPQPSLVEQLSPSLLQASSLSLNRDSSVASWSRYFSKLSDTSSDDHDDTYIPQDSIQSLAHVPPASTSPSAYDTSLDNDSTHFGAKPLRLRIDPDIDESSHDTIVYGGPVSLHTDNSYNHVRTSSAQLDPLFMLPDSILELYYSRLPFAGYQPHQLSLSSPHETNDTHWLAGNSSVHPPTPTPSYPPHAPVAVFPHMPAHFDTMVDQVDSRLVEMQPSPTSLSVSLSSPMTQPSPFSDGDLSHCFKKGKSSHLTSTHLIQASLVAARLVSRRHQSHPSPSAVLSSFTSLLYLWFHHTFSHATIHIPPDASISVPAGILHTMDVFLNLSDRATYSQSPTSSMKYPLESLVQRIYTVVNRLIDEYIPDGLKPSRTGTIYGFLYCLLASQTKQLLLLLLSTLKNSTTPPSCQGKSEMVQSLSSPHPSSPQCSPQSQYVFITILFALSQRIAADYLDGMVLNTSSVKSAVCRDDIHMGSSNRPGAETEIGMVHPTTNTRESDKDNDKWGNSPSEPHGSPVVDIESTDVFHLYVSITNPYSFGIPLHPLHLHAFFLTPTGCTSSHVHDHCHQDQNNSRTNIHHTSTTHHSVKSQPSRSSPDMASPMGTGDRPLGTSLTRPPSQREDPTVDSIHQMSPHRDLTSLAHPHHLDHQQQQVYISHCISKSPLPAFEFASLSLQPHNSSGPDDCLESTLSHGESLMSVYLHPNTTRTLAIGVRVSPYIQALLACHSDAPPFLDFCIHSLTVSVDGVLTTIRLKNISHMHSVASLGSAICDIKSLTPWNYRYPRTPLSLSVNAISHSFQRAIRVISALGRQFYNKSLPNDLLLALLQYQNHISPASLAPAQGSYTQERNMVKSLRNRRLLRGIYPLPMTLPRANHKSKRFYRHNPYYHIPTDAAFSVTNHLTYADDETQPIEYAHRKAKAKKESSPWADSTTQPTGGQHNAVGLVQSSLSQQEQVDYIICRIRPQRCKASLRDARPAASLCSHSGGLQGGSCRHPLFPPLPFDESISPLGAINQLNSPDGTTKTRHYAMIGQHLDMPFELENISTEQIFPPVIQPSTSSSSFPVFHHQTTPFHARTPSSSMGPGFTPSNTNHNHTLLPTQTPTDITCMIVEVFMAINLLGTPETDDIYAVFDEGSPSWASNQGNAGLAQPEDDDEIDSLIGSTAKAKHAHQQRVGRLLLPAFELSLVSHEDIICSQEPPSLALSGATSDHLHDAAHAGLLARSTLPSVNSATLAPTSPANAEFLQEKGFPPKKGQSRQQIWHRLTPGLDYVVNRDEIASYLPLPAGTTAPINVSLLPALSTITIPSLLMNYEQVTTDFCDNNQDGVWQTCEPSTRGPTPEQSSDVDCANGSTPSSIDLLDVPSLLKHISTQLPLEPPIPIEETTITCVVRVSYSNAPPYQSYIKNGIQDPDVMTPTIPSLGNVVNHHWFRREVHQHCTVQYRNAIQWNTISVSSSFNVFESLPPSTIPLTQHQWRSPTEKRGVHDHTALPSGEDAMVPSFLYDGIQYHKQHCIVATLTNKTGIMLRIAPRARDPLGSSPYNLEYPDSRDVHHYFLHQQDGTMQVILPHLPVLIPPLETVNVLIPIPTDLLPRITADGGGAQFKTSTSMSPIGDGAWSPFLDFIRLFNHPHFEELVTLLTTAMRQPSLVVLPRHGATQATPALSITDCLRSLLQPRNPMGSDTGRALCVMLSFYLTWTHRITQHCLSLDWQAVSSVCIDCGRPQPTYGARNNYLHPSIYSSGYMSSIHHHPYLQSHNGHDSYHVLSGHVGMMNSYLLHTGPNSGMSLYDVGTGVNAKHPPAQSSYHIDQSAQSSYAFAKYHSEYPLSPGGPLAALPVVTTKMMTLDLFAYIQLLCPFISLSLSVLETGDHEQLAAFAHHPTSIQGAQASSAVSPHYHWRTLDRMPSDTSKNDSRENTGQQEATLWPMETTCILSHPIAIDLSRDGAYGEHRGHDQLLHGLASNDPEPGLLLPSLLDQPPSIAAMNISHSGVVHTTPTDDISQRLCMLYAAIDIDNDLAPLLQQCHLVIDVTADGIGRGNDEIYRNTGSGSGNSSGSGSGGGRTSTKGGGNHAESASGRHSGDPGTAPLSAPASSLLTALQSSNQDMLYDGSTSSALLGPSPAPYDDDLEGSSHEEVRLHHIEISMDGVGAIQASLQDNINQDPTALKTHRESPYMNDMGAMQEASRHLHLYLPLQFDLTDGIDPTLAVSIQLSLTLPDAQHHHTTDGTTNVLVLSAAEIGL